MATLVLIEEPSKIRLVTFLSASVTVPPGVIDGAVNVGTGVGLFKQKLGSTLQFKSLIEGSFITLTDGADEVQVSVTGLDALEQLPGTCQAADAVGDLVRTSGAVAGGRYQVQKVDVDELGTYPAWATIISKNGATECEIQRGGVISGLYTGLIPGRRYFVGSDARPNLVAPTSAGAYLQVIGVAVGSSELLFSPQLTMHRRA